jgi:hypothetical protein
MENFKAAYDNKAFTLSHGWIVLDGAMMNNARELIAV